MTNIKVCFSCEEIIMVEAALLLKQAGQGYGMFRVKVPFFKLYIALITKVLGYPLSS